MSDNQQEAPTIIIPTIGRKLHFFPNGYSIKGYSSSPCTDRSIMGLHPPYDSQPFDATVVYVWSDRLVNLRVTDHTGNAAAVTSVVLRQEGDPIPSCAYCEWMPYQKGQAAKTEALEKAAAGGVR